MTHIPTITHQDVVRRFNDELITHGRRSAFMEIVAPDFIDHTAPPSGASAQALEHFIFDMLRVAIPDIRVEIHDLITEGNKVTTRKTFHGTFTNDLLGIAATRRAVAIGVIDILVVRDGRITEHWGMNNFAAVAQA